MVGSAANATVYVCRGVITPVSPTTLRKALLGGGNLGVNVFESVDGELRPLRERVSCCWRDGEGEKEVGEADTRTYGDLGVVGSPLSDGKVTIAVGWGDEALVSVEIAGRTCDSYRIDDTGHIQY